MATLSVVLAPLSVAIASLNVGASEAVGSIDAAAGRVRPAGAGVGEAAGRSRIWDCWPANPAIGEIGAVRWPALTDRRSLWLNPPYGQEETPRPPESANIQSYRSFAAHLSC